MNYIFKNFRLLCLLILFLPLFVACDSEEKKETGMYVYKLKTKDISRKHFRSVVQQYSGEQELTGEFAELKDDKMFRYTDDENNIYYFQDAATGNFSFNRGIQKYLGRYTPDLPASGKAEELAMRFLEKNEAMPGEKDQLELVHSGGLRADAGPNGKVIDKMRTMTYGRVLDSMPVMGAGSKIVVNIGHEGEITGLTHKWREIDKENRDPVLEKETISKEEAKETFEKNLLEEFGKEAAFDIKEIKLVYYDGDGEYIQPVYGVRAVVKVNLNEKETNQVPYLTYVPALKQPPEALNLKVGGESAERYIKRLDEGTGEPGDEKGTD